jgi:hypothetical protein
MTVRCSFILKNNAQMGWVVLPLLVCSADIEEWRNNNMAL